MRAEIIIAANKIRKHRVTVHSRDSSPWRDKSAALPRAVQPFVGEPACPTSCRSFTYYVMHNKSNVAGKTLLDDCMSKSDLLSFSI